MRWRRMHMTKMNKLYIVWVGFRENAQSKIMGPS